MGKDMERPSRGDMMTERLLPTTASGSDDKQLRWLREASVTPMGSTTASSSNGSAPTAASVPSQQGELQLAAVLIALSSFLWGYGVAVLNVCIVPDAIGSLLAEINLSTSEQETATALVVVGALVSALTTGGIGERIGQKKTILANNVFYIVGGIVCALAMSKKAIFVGRFCIGYAWMVRLCLCRDRFGVVSHLHTLTLQNRLGHRHEHGTDPTE